MRLVFCTERFQETYRAEVSILYCADAYSHAGTRLYADSYSYTSVQLALLQSHNTPTYAQMSGQPRGLKAFDAERLRRRVGGGRV